MRVHAPVLAVLALALLFGIGGNGPKTASGAADPVIAAAGDIACDPANANFNGGQGTSSNCRQLHTSDLLTNAGLAAVLPLGDNQYYCGSLAAFNAAFEPSWGRVKSIIRPTTGNHEYLTHGGTSPSTGCDLSNEGAAGYFNYFGPAGGQAGKGYYSFDLGGWHLIALNSQCSRAGGCGPGTPQYAWLQNDLAAHAVHCILAYWHIPLFSSGGRAESNSLPFWNALYAAHADVILNSHDHIYERFLRQDPTGAADEANGIREFIAGTGGANHTSIAAVAANSELRDTTTYGVLELALHAGSYDWEFVPDPGSGTFTDSGSEQCHPKRPAVTLSGVTAVGATRATLHGAVNPDGQATAYHFEFGATKAYGRRTPATAVGSGESWVAVSASIGGLTPGIAHHYRLVAANSLGTTASRDATFRTPHLPQMLSVARAGNGSGTISSSPAGIGCGSVCRHAFAYGTGVTLRAKPEQESAFIGWSGACAGTRSCTLTMTTSRSATARFEKLCLVPRVKGRKLKPAKRAIGKAHCSVGKVSRVFSRKVKKGRVVSQRPYAGVTRPPGAKLTLRVSKGRHHRH